MEIERKFLVARLPENFASLPKKEARQGYLEISGEKEVRVRQKGNKYFRTLKIGSGKIREEIETEISAEEFNALWPETAGKRVEKTRYSVPSDNYKIDLDVFKGDLKGHITVEVEFESVEASNNFQPFDWFGREVTDDKRYKNQSLAVYGLPKD